MHDGKINGASSLFNTFTIRDMLKDVKDYDGNNYIDEEGKDISPSGYDIDYAQSIAVTDEAVKDNRPE